jgi:nitrate reductase molybdenum cofactor assembly chaperone NarJ/NarW
MVDQSCSAFKIASVLLQYPDEALLRDLKYIREAARQIRHQPTKDACMELLTHLEQTSLILSQEGYTNTFDLNPQTSLNLTYHRFGESRERGRALGQFSQMYREEGYEAATGELPDYLPMLLEFLSVCSTRRGTQLLSQYLREITTLSSRLADQSSPYAGLLGIIASSSRELQR